MIKVLEKTIGAISEIHFEGVRNLSRREAVDKQSKKWLKRLFDSNCYPCLLIPPFPFPCLIFFCINYHLLIYCIIDLNFKIVYLWGP